MRGEPYLGGDEPAGGRYPRPPARSPPARRSVRRTVRRACFLRAAWVITPSIERLAFEMLTTARLRDAFDSEPRRSAPARALRAIRSSARPHCWPAGWSSGACASSTSVGTITRKRFGVSKAAWDTHERNFPMLTRDVAPQLRPDVFGLPRRPGRPRTAGRDARRDDGRDGPHAQGQRQGRPRPLDLLLFGASGRRGHQGRYDLRRFRRPRGVHQR